MQKNNAQAGLSHFDVSNKAVEEVANKILQIVRRNLRMGSKNFYLFSEGNAQMKELLGGKGANLAEMTRIGLPVPPGFTVSTAACLEYFRREQKIWPELQDEVLAALRKLEEIKGKKFGDKTNPLLVSVRSGAVISMPGMMDTVLNLGLNDETVLRLAAAASNERFAYDRYRRFIQMFGDVVLDIDHYLFEHTLRRKRLWVSGMTPGLTPEPCRSWWRIQRYCFQGNKNTSRRNPKSS